MSLQTVTYTLWAPGAASVGPFPGPQLRFRRQRHAVLYVYAWSESAADAGTEIRIEADGVPLMPNIELGDSYEYDGYWQPADPQDSGDYPVIATNEVVTAEFAAVATPNAGGDVSVHIVTIAEPSLSDWIASL